METVGQIIFSGVIIGILTSAPMGPVGMLIIQRTLNKGRWPAFFTGVGAGISDLLYSLLTGLGLSFITDFIEGNKMVLQILGSLVLICFSIYLFRKNPARSLRKHSDNKGSFLKDFATGFIFTFSNPLIMFFIIGLFGRFNFLLPEYLYYHYIAAFTAIFCGTLIWWYFITFIVNKLRTHFNVRSMWIMNRAIGSVIFIMAIVGIYQGVEGLIINDRNEQVAAYTQNN